MAQLSSKIIKYLERKVDFTKDVILRDNGDGVVYIAEWNVAEAQPTDAQLDALDAQATTIENNNKVISTRKGLYGTLEQQIENIMENGLQSEIDRVNQIKTENPKS
tara:strand:+ start:172 stop:489 length:318 start_codon:yes stop_codon:yes gene_type:complete